MKATQRLPDHYQMRASLDASRDKKVMLALNLIGLLLLLPFGWLFGRLFAIIRPDLMDMSLEITGIGSNLLFLGQIVVVIIFVVLLHELVHGVFIWGFTGSRPQFGVGMGYAYAAAPGWYFPRWQHWVIALAPLLLISVGGLALLLILPVSAVFYLFLALLFNAVGAVGDLAMVGWLLLKPAHTLVLDTGPAIFIYH